MKSDPRIAKALMATARNGKAIRIPLNGEDYSRLVNRYSTLLLSRGYRLHSSNMGTTAVCWAEQVKVLMAWVKRSNERLPAWSGQRAR